MRSFLVLASSLFLCSCADVSLTERKPVPPKGSDESSIPWNRPGAGEGAGALGGLLEGR